MFDGTTTTVGKFRRRGDLDNAVRVLGDAGIQAVDISRPVPGKWGAVALYTRGKQNAFPNLVPGAGIGVGLGTTVGWLATIDVLAIPNLWPLAVAPIVTVLVGAGAGGLVGSITGALSGISVSEGERDRYERLLRTGGFLLSVTSARSDSEATKKAKKFLQMCGADVASEPNIALSSPSAVTLRGIS